MTALLFRLVLVLPLVLAGALGGAESARAQGATTTRITEEPVVSQPPPFSTSGKTVVGPRTRIEIDEGGRRLKGDARRKAAKPDTEGEAEVEPEAAPDLSSPAEAGSAEAGGCRGSEILCGDPLRRKKTKGE